MAIRNMNDAVEIWLCKWRGDYIKRISAKFDIDPRRIYEVLSEEKFVGSREIALRRLQRELPALAMTVDTKPHVARRHVVSLDKSQPDLFP